MLLAADDYEIDLGIRFLIANTRAWEGSLKRVALHSISVVLHLYDYGFRREAGLAGLLHDMLECRGRVAGGGVRLKVSRLVPLLTQFKSPFPSVFCPMR